MSWPILLLVLSSCFQHPVANGQAHTGRTDTIRLGSTTGTYHLMDKITVVNTRIPLAANSTKPLKGYSLLFKDAVLHESPEGVYEVYLSNAPLTAGQLTAEHPGFVDVLNTYSLPTASGSRQDVHLDITQLMKHLNTTGNKSTLYVTILFRGNVAANKQESVHAGDFTFSAVVIEGVK
jgi:hypothetical protein